MVSKLCILLAVTACIIRAAAGITLESVLASYQVPLAGLPSEKRQQPITSYAASKGGPVFLLAYYDDLGQDILPPEMNVLRYDRRNGHFAQAVLTGDEVIPARIMTQVSQFCLGSALTISEEKNGVVINTHLNPSAGCVIVLDDELRFKVSLPGQFLIWIGDQLLIETNTVNFAPTHPERLMLFSLHSMQLTRIYPADNDTRRRRFSELLKAHLPSPAWCQKFDDPCDPTVFTTYFLNMKADPSGHAFSFDVRMSPDGFGPDAGVLIQPQIVHYKCRFLNGEWTLTSN